MSFSRHPLENILAIVGPTASGKSTLSFELARAAKTIGIPLEIISMDSALVYKGMNIGTAKPTHEELDLVPHHGIDIRHPSQSYSAAHFAKDACKWASEIRQRGNLPVIVGGTMLYWRSLMQGLTHLPASTPEVRQQIAQEAAEVGWDSMYIKLQQIDPLVASRLPPGDTQRISRALEVFYMTGTPMSQLLSAQPYAQSRDASSFAHLLISLEPLHRDWLHTRIQERFMKMLDSDFMGEVKNLLQDPHIHSDLPAMRAVGYRQAIAYLNDELSYDAFIDAGLAASRQLGKRQLTWLRAMPSRQVIDPSSPQWMSQAIKACLEHLSRFKSQ
jgi:tRNA dimethylallyltransferase